jgi:hypothetical protein
VWVCYSVNKEDIWVSRVRLPAGGTASGDAWNTYSPKWAPCTVTTTDGIETVQLEDRDPSDYARASRVFGTPATSLDVAFDVRMDKGATEPLHIELTGPRAAQAVMLTVKPTDLAAGEWRTIRLHANCEKRSATMAIGDEAAATNPFAVRAPAITSITFRTGDRTENLSPRPRPPHRTLAIPIERFRPPLKMRSRLTYTNEAAFLD